MSQSNRYEQQFLTKLRAVFIGAQVEGDSGFINLMHIKVRYFEEGVFPQLRKDIDAACAPFVAGFREELFDKLYDFFSRYFSESGSIYFRHTAPHQSVYERVYTDDRDVMLFWKTHMLYYVKTDRLFNNMAVTVDGQRFFFDVAGLEHKRANEKRELLFTFTRRDADDQLVFAVAYSEKGSKTKLDDVLKAVKQSGGVLDEATLTQACRVFEQQSEVDYFINKNARAFLREQFDLWLYQYLFKGESSFDAVRLRQLQALQGIAYKIIDFIAQFEDELVRIWNKPKFVRNSHYVITLDKLRSKDDALLQRTFAHAGMAAQLAEWRDLGMVDDAIADAAALLDKLLVRDLTGAPAHPHLQFLPLDTRYFPDLELEILATFADLDAALDGWLVHSENYQALVTLLPKFREEVQAVYVDPPYNASATEIIYENRYRHSSWLTLIKDRLLYSIGFLRSTGLACITIDDYEISRLQLAMDEVFGEENYLGTVLIRNNPSGRSTVKGFAVNHEYGLFYAKSSDKVKVGRFAHTEEQLNRYDQVDASGKRYEWENLRKSSSGSLKKDRPKQYFPIYFNQETGALRVPRLDWDKLLKEYDVLEAPEIEEVVLLPLDESGTDRVWSYGVQRTLAEIKEFIVSEDNGKKEIYKKKYLNEAGILARTWWDNPSYSARDNGTRGQVDLFGSSKLFEFPKAVKAVEDSLTVCSADVDSLVLDFFAGSGTTAHAVMNLNRADNGRRKYILVEMGEHFHTVILPRIKKVAFSDKWKNGKPVLSKAEGAVPGGQGMSHFVKYYDLEQYEETLRRAHYADALPLAGSDPYTSYVFLRDLKLLDAVTVDVAQNSVAVDLCKLYPDIDLAETLSCLTG